MKRGLLVLIIFLLTIASVSALQVKYENIQPEALPGGSISYLILLHNNEASTLKVKFISPDLNWLLDQEDKQIFLEAGESKNYTVSYKPLSGTRIVPGNYAVRLTLNTQFTAIEKILTAQVFDYKEVLDSEFVITPTIDPKRGTTLRLSVKNKHSVDLENLNLELVSEHFKFTKMFSLGKKEFKTFEFPVKVDPNTLKGDYNSKIKVNLANNLMLDKDLSYSIKEYQELRELTLPQTGFLLSGETVTYSNAGNFPVTQTISRDFGWFAFKLTSFSPEPTRVKSADGGYVAEWDLTVNPQSSVSVDYVVNYRLPIIVLILIIIALFAWYIVRQRNAIVVVKRVFAMHSETGSVRVMKVLLNIRNRGAITVNNVRLVDRVPSSVKAPTQHGMLKPTHVKAAPEGTVMVWDLLSVKPGEEKIISYRIEGNINMLGRLVLPPAIVKYVLFGRGVTARSSSVSLREKK